MRIVNSSIVFYPMATFCLNMSQAFLSSLCMMMKPIHLKWLSIVKKARELSDLHNKHKTNVIKIAKETKTKLQLRNSKFNILATSKINQKKPHSPQKNKLKLCTISCLIQVKLMALTEWSHLS